MDKTRILVIDDEEEICQLTKSFLSKKNYLVLTATSEAEAIELIKKEQPHLALLDMRLGDTSGLDVLRKIKEIDKTIKVIMITALEDEESVRQAKSLGAEDYITKPFSASYLIDLLSKKIPV